MHWICWAGFVRVVTPQQSATATQGGAIAVSCIFRRLVMTELTSQILKIRKFLATEKFADFAGSQSTTVSQSDMMDNQNSVGVDVSVKANAKNATTTPPLYRCHVDRCRYLERWQEWSSSYHEGLPTRDPGSRRATGKTILVVSRHSLTEEDGRSVASHVPGSGKTKKKKRSSKSRNDRRSLSPEQTK